MQPFFITRTSPLALGSLEFSFKQILWPEKFENPSYRQHSSLALYIICGLYRQSWKHLPSFTKDAVSTQTKIYKIAQRT